MLAAELGISGASVTRAEALLTLPEDVQAMVDDGRLAESAAYEISRLKDEDAMRELASMVVAGRMNRDQVTRGGAAESRQEERHAQGRAGGGQARRRVLLLRFSAGELTPETLLRAIDQIRSKLKELQKGEQKTCRHWPSCCGHRKHSPPCPCRSAGRAGHFTDQRSSMRRLWAADHPPHAGDGGGGALFNAVILGLRFEVYGIIALLGITYRLSRKRWHTSGAYGTARKIGAGELIAGQAARRAWPDPWPGGACDPAI